jgi:histone arginine demethylase JMJD6
MVKSNRALVRRKPDPKSCWIAIGSTIIAAIASMIYFFLPSSPHSPTSPWKFHPQDRQMSDRDLECISPENIQIIPKMTTLEYNRLHSTKKLCSPIIISDALQQWSALSKWDSNFFREKYGKERATAKGKLEGETQDSFALPLHMFASHAHEGYHDAWTYLQDELFLPSHPELLEDLVPEPAALQHDWFKYLPPSIRPANAFLLWGTAHSRSSLHIDPYNWTGSNALIRGSKHWKFIPPHQDHLLYPLKDALCGSPLECYKYQSSVDAFTPNYRKFPKFQKAKVIDAEQSEGELMLIPPGWYHQAFNPVESIAVASQLWSDDAFDVTFAEIIKYKSNVDASLMPTTIERKTMSKGAQFEALLRAIPDSVKKEAEFRLQDALQKINGQKKEKGRSGKKQRHGQPRNNGRAATATRNKQKRRRRKFT